MKKSELKQVLKPLIKECIKEVIFEEGVLSGIIYEVVQGMRTAQLVERQERTTPRTIKRQPMEDEMRLMERKKKFDAERKKLLAAVNKDAYNGVDLFEGTKPIRNVGTPSTDPKPPSSPLAGVDPADPGVDISSLVGGLNYKGLF